MTREYVPAFPRPVRQTDEDYLRFIRRQPCLLHHVAAEAHHVTSRGAGGSDFRTVPLCRKHHREIHQHGRSWFEVHYTVALELEMLRYLEIFISALRGGENLGER